MMYTTTLNQKLKFFSKTTKHFVSSIGLAMLMVAMSGSVWAQTPGESCDDPLVVDALPFTASGNTATYGNNYVLEDVPALAPNAITDGTGSEYYLSGSDVVFAYTPVANQMVNVTTTNDDDWIGLWAFTGCPFASTVGYHTSIDGATRAINNLPLIGGTTYYFVISTWSPPESTDFTINIEEEIPDCPGLGLNIGDPCDDGDPNTINDVITEDCECAGILPPDGMVCEAPIVVTDLPYTTTDNTATYGDNYEPADVPALAPGAIGEPLSSYLSGDDVVYAYTPAANEVINISVTEHGTWTGLYVFTECPFASTLGGETNSSDTEDLEVNLLPVEAGVTYYIVISTNAAPQSTPYTLNITKLEECTGASAGIPDEDLLLVCADTEFTLAVSGATEPATGLVSTWQSSPAGDNNWADIAGTSSPSYTVTGGISEATDFRYIVTCTLNDESDTSDVIQVTLEDPIDCYCLANFENSVEPITYVSFVDIDNTSSASATEAYEDFTDQSTEVFAGATYEITLKGFTGGNWTNFFTVFIDWDQNGVLGDAGEIYEIGSITNSTGEDDISVMGDIQVPFDALPGTTRMRIVKNFSTSPLDPCGSYGYGQVEDYSVEVAPLEACTGADAGTPNEVALVVCANDPFTVAVTGASDPAEGQTRIWQSSPAGDNNWTDITGANSPTYIVVGGIQADTDFRYVVTCSNTSETDESDIIEVSLNPNLSECYCTPVLDCTDGDLIENVSFLEIDNTTACSPDGYGNYTDMEATTMVGQTYSISVTVGDGWDVESVSVWIDFDNSGSFDEDEFFYIGTGSGEVVTNDITIPTDAIPDAYVMRVRVAAVPEINATADMACDESQGYGETEDYTVIVEPVSVKENDYGFEMGPNPTKDIIQLTSTENIQSIAIYNIAGQLVMNNQIDAQSPTVDLSALQNGIYLMEVTIKDHKEVYKVVKH